MEKLHDKDTFLQHRKNQESKHFDSVDTTSLLSSILTVELNITEFTNDFSYYEPELRIEALILPHDFLLYLDQIKYHDHIKDYILRIFLGSAIVFLFVLLSI